MPSEPIPEDVREFIQTYIDSIAELEALLLLRRETSTSWNTTTVAARLYVTKEDAADLLKKLLAHGFLKFSRKMYQYQCPAEMDLLVGRVAEFYARQLIPMTHLIHSKPGRIREFANAFKLRKEP
jgi:hypothetical protein